jgi:hypothetical protein
MDYEQRVIIRFLHREGVAPDEIFGHVKAGLAGQSFAGPEGLCEGIMAFLGEGQVSELKLVFHDWVERIRYALDHNRDYYNK